MMSNAALFFIAAALWHRNADRIDYFHCYISSAFCGVFGLLELMRYINSL